MMSTKLAATLVLMAALSFALVATLAVSAQELQPKD